MSQESPTFSPLYRQIKALILQALEAGEWRPGQAIPSEQELARASMCRKAPCARPSTRWRPTTCWCASRARVPYVASHNDPRALFPLSCGWCRSMAISLAAERAAGLLAAKAGQEARACWRSSRAHPIIIVRRLLKFAGKPVVIDEIYLPGEVFQG
jgi:GntR family transcriptional regulator